MVTTQLHTAEDLLKLSTAEEDFDLIEGELIVLSPTSFDHGVIQSNITTLIQGHVRSRKLGKVATESGFIFSRDPDTVLAPDVSFVRESRLPAVTSSFLNLAPDLAVEIVSPGNTPGEIERKISIYLRSGVRQVWIVYPDEREVVIHTPSGPPRVFADTDQIENGDVLPDLGLSVAEIFA